MYISFIIITILISISKYGEKVGNLVIKYKKIISNFLYFLSVGFFLILTNDLIQIKETGEQTLELLWIILWLPILAKVGNLVLAKKLMIFRKELGILMGSLALVHSLQYFFEPYSYMFWELKFWYNNGITYLTWGMLATIIAIILTITSNKFFMKKLGRKWKMLHRTVYVLLIFTLIHVAAVKIFYSSEKENPIFEYIEVFFPFVLYFIGKILEYKKIRLDLIIKNNIKKYVKK